MILAELKNAAVASVVTFLVCCVVYPAMVWSAARLLFPFRADGSLVYSRDGVIVGATLVGDLSRIGLITLATISVAVQLLSVTKHPEQFTAMARRHVLASMPRFGADYGGRDYWDARGGDLLGRALRDESSGTARARSLGYLWGLPDASATIRFREARDVQIGLYAVDWDRQSRTETVTIEDALGGRTIDLGPEMATGVWAITDIRGDPAHPVTIRLRQTGPDTAVLSAITFDKDILSINYSIETVNRWQTITSRSALR